MIDTRIRHLLVPLSQVILTFVLKIYCLLIDIFDDTVYILVPTESPGGFEYSDV